MMKISKKALKRTRKRLILLSVGVFVSFGFIMANGVATNAELADTIHYPDLQTEIPSDINIQLSGDQKLLRFSNTVYNLGEGPLELRPENDKKGVTKAYQRIYSHNSSDEVYLVEENLVGNFEFHRIHHHWHFENFALYELLEDINSSPGDVVKSNSKTTFCIIDTTVAPDGDTLEHFGWGGTYNKRTGTWSGYSKCTKTSINGISVGYGDRYNQSLSGQSIDITGIPDGCYWLKSTADPDNLLKEKDNNNNSAVARIFISGDTVSLSCS